MFKLVKVLLLTKVITKLHSHMKKRATGESLASQRDARCNYGGIHRIYYLEKVFDLVPLCVICAREKGRDWQLAGSFSSRFFSSKKKRKCQNPLWWISNLKQAIWNLTLPVFTAEKGTQRPSLLKKTASITSGSSLMGEKQTARWKTGYVYRVLFSYRIL